MSEAPGFDLDHKPLGEKVRRLRKSRNLSLQALGQLAGLSTPLISQIERGSSSPSMRSLRQLAHGLGVSVQTLFSDDTPEEGCPGIVRHDRRRILNLAHTGISIELLTPGSFAALQTFYAYIIPGGSSGSEYDSHVGSESGVILMGQMELWLDGTKSLLNPGDSFSFESTTPHRYLNPGNSIMHAYWVITPPIY